MRRVEEEGVGGWDMGFGEENRELSGRRIHHFQNMPCQPLVDLPMSGDGWETRELGL